MISKLRRKFIFINMLLVSLVLLCVLGIFCFSNYNRVKASNQRSLSQALAKPDGDEPPPMVEVGKPDKDNGAPFHPTVVVQPNQDGTVTILKETLMTISDDILKQAVSQATDSSSLSGRLSGLSLRYEKKQMTDGSLRIAFGDCSQEIQTIKSLLLTSVLIFAGAFAAFFLISLFLSKWALLPVSRAWDQQKQFIADASHELKTPLTVILANLNILSSHKTESIGQQFQWVENSQTEAAHMKKIVEDLLFLARSDAGELPNERERLNLSDLLLSCCLSFEPVAFEKGIFMEEEISQDIMISADPGQLKQLISILLDNACKYTPVSGSLSVILKQESNRILCSISNTGPSIPPQELPHIFERFYRADKSRSKQSGGYGLGLSIAKTIVDNYGGTITAQSLGERTVFTVVFK